MNAGPNLHSLEDSWLQECDVPPLSNIQHLYTHGLGFGHRPGDCKKNNHKHCKLIQKTNHAKLF